MDREYITPETREAVNEAAIRRTPEQVIKEGNRLYAILKEDVDNALITGGDYITHTVERKIGKTWTLIRIAMEHDNIPIVVQNESQKRLIERQARAMSDTKIEVLTVEQKMHGRAEFKAYDVVLKEEMVTVEAVRAKITTKGIVGIN